MLLYFVGALARFWLDLGRCLNLIEAQSILQFDESAKVATNTFCSKRLVSFLALDFINRSNGILPQVKRL